MAFSDTWEEAFPARKRPKLYTSDTPSSDGYYPLGEVSSFLTANLQTLTSNQLHTLATNNYHVLVAAQQEWHSLEKLASSLKAKSSSRVDSTNTDTTTHTKDPQALLTPDQYEELKESVLYDYKTPSFTNRATIPVKYSLTAPISEQEKIDCRLPIEPFEQSGKIVPLKDNKSYKSLMAEARARGTPGDPDGFGSETAVNIAGFDMGNKGDGKLWVPRVMPDEAKNISYRTRSRLGDQTAGLSPVTDSGEATGRQTRFGGDKVPATRDASPMTIGTPKGQRSGTPANSISSPAGKKRKLEEVAVTVDGVQPPPRKKHPNQYTKRREAAEAAAAAQRLAEANGTAVPPPPPPVEAPVAPPRKKHPNQYTKRREAAEAAAAAQRAAEAEAARQNGVHPGYPAHHPPPPYQQPYLFPAYHYPAQPQYQSHPLPPHIPLPTKANIWTMTTEEKRAHTFKDAELVETIKADHSWLHNDPEVSQSWKDRIVAAEFPVRTWAMLRKWSEWKSENRHKRPRNKNEKIETADSDTKSAILHDSLADDGSAASSDGSLAGTIENGPATRATHDTHDIWGVSRNSPSKRSATIASVYGTQHTAQVGSPLIHAVNARDILPAHSNGIKREKDSSSSIDELAFSDSHENSSARSQRIRPRRNNTNTQPASLSINGISLLNTTHSPTTLRYTTTHGTEDELAASQSSTTTKRTRTMSRSPHPALLAEDDHDHVDAAASPSEPPTSPSLPESESDDSYSETHAPVRRKHHNQYTKAKEMAALQARAEARRRTLIKEKARKETPPARSSQESVGVGGSGSGRPRRAAAMGVASAVARDMDDVEEETDDEDEEGELVVGRKSLRSARGKGA